MTTPQLFRVIIIWITSWLMFDILSVPVHGDAQFWMGIVFVVIVGCTSGYALWLTYDKQYPSTVRARIREGVRRGREAAKERQ